MSTFTRERLRKEKRTKACRELEEGGRGRENINPAECLGHYPLQR